MLQIQGTSGFPMGNLLGKDKERGGQRLEEMMEQFARRLDELRLVIENGERGVVLGIGGEGSFHDADFVEGVRGPEDAESGVRPWGER
jgi:hypothetical protein